MTTTDFHTRLRKAREDAGLTLDETTFRIWALLPKSMRISKAKLSRLETKTAEETADPFLITVLSNLYGCTVSDLSPLAAESLDTLREQVIKALPCITARAA